MPAALVELAAVTKTFGTGRGAVRALEDVDLTLSPGLVHAVVGENGAGKSTLLKVVAGVVEADHGRVDVFGAPLAPATPREAIRRGVGMVHQHFMLVPTLTGLQNLALGFEPTRHGFLDFAPLAGRVAKLQRGLELPVRTDVPVGSLSVGERQRLEILRVLLRTEESGRPRVIILDEPTAVLAPSEAAAVLELARRLAAEGAAVALVTHRLDEVAAWADEVTVMRRGRRVAHHGPGDPIVRDAAALANEALGDTGAAAVIASPKSDAEVVFALAGVDAADDAAGRVTRVDLEVHEGEIVGIAGVEGNGQLALELVAAGLLAPSAGRIALDGVDVTRLSVRRRRALGLAFIPGDRHHLGLAEELSAADSVRLGALSEVASGPLSLLVDEAALGRAFDEAVRAFDIRPTDGSLAAGALSGGNQQKLVVARELRARAVGPRSAASSPRFVVAAHPTRGVDARVARRIRDALGAVAAAGGGVLVVSSDLSELRALAHRILVLRRGEIVAELPASASDDELGAAMLGVGTDSVPRARAAEPTR